MSERAGGEEFELLPHHREHLLGSGLSDATVELALIGSVTDPGVAARLLGWSGKSGPVPAIVFPYHGVDGQEPSSVVLRPDVPHQRGDGSAPKYESPAGWAHHLYLPPEPLVSRAALADSSVPLLIVEGIKKALSAAQFGVTVVSGQGVSVFHDIECRRATGEFRLHPDFEHIPLNGRTVFIGFDGGDTSCNPSVIHAEARIARLLVDAGARVRVLRIPTPDLKTKVGLDDCLVVEAHPRAAIEKLFETALEGCPLARAKAAMAGKGEERARAVVELLRDLSFGAALLLAPRVVFDQVCALLKSVASKTSFRECRERFRAALGAKARSSETTESPAHPYQIVDGQTCLCEREQVVPLANFTARIVEELVVDAGDGEGRRLFRLGGALADGTPLPTIDVSASEFAEMRWPEGRWGARAAPAAGRGRRDQLREAIQRTSNPTSRTVFSHLGWRRQETGWVFLHSGGAVGADDVEVRVEPPLDRFVLPAGGSGSVAAIETSLRLLDAGPIDVTAPLLGAVYLAPLASLAGADLSLFLRAPTGSLKSVLTALAVSHFGTFSWNSLAANWEGTPNALEKMLFLAKDVLFAIDDFAPRSSETAQAKMEAAAQRIFRAQANRSARARMGRDATLHGAFPPRGLLISSGEDVPPGASINARLVVVDVNRERLNLAVISALQGAAGLLPQAMRAYIEWLAPQVDELEIGLHKELAALRDLAGTNLGHARAPSNAAQLMLGIRAGLRFAYESGHLSDEAATNLEQRCFAGVLHAARAQAAVAREVDPATQILDVLRTLLVQHRVRLEFLARARERPLGDVGGGALLGWHDGSFAFVLPNVLREEVGRVVRSTGGALVLGDRAVAEALLARNLLVPGGEKGRLTDRIRVGDSRVRVLKLRLDVLRDSADPDGPTAGTASGPDSSTVISGGSCRAAPLAPDPGN